MATAQFTIANGKAQLGAILMHVQSTFTRGGRLYRKDAAGNLYVWEPSTGTGLGELGGLWKKIKNVHKKITKTAKKIIKAPIKLHQKVQKAVLKSKYGRALVTGAGAVFAPFTGGLSLAAAQAATRYGKARYVQGASRSDAYKKGAVGAAVGYVAGVGLVYGAGAAGIGPGSVAGRSASILTPFGTASAPIVSAASPQAFSYASYATPGASTGASVASAASAPTSWLTTFASAAKTATSLLPIVSAFMPKPQGGGGESFDPAMVSTGTPYPGAYSEDYGGGGGGGGGGNMPPEIDPETGEPIAPPSIPPAMLAAALGGLFLFTTMGGKRRSRKRGRGRK